MADARPHSSTSHEKEAATLSTGCRFLSPSLAESPPILPTPPKYYRSPGVSIPRARTAWPSLSCAVARRVCYTRDSMATFSGLTVHFPVRVRPFAFPRMDTPVMAKIQVAIEPIDFSDFCKIFTGQPFGDEKIMGMFQINSFIPFTPAEVAGIAATKLETWRRTRDDVDTKDPAFAGCSVILLELLGPGQCFALPVIIERAVVDLMQKFLSEDTITGTVMDAPFNIQTYLE
ncbi:hypothetical protein DFH09DRAFT_1450625 [Mycena vulgaris]|nr:hypothetical protein DFH09DRAFT_1450625 [Mycena vulgaris]